MYTRFTRFIGVAILAITISVTTAETAHGDEAEIRNLYKLAQQDIDLRLEEVRALVAYFNTTHAGQPYLEERFGAGLSEATGRISLDKHLEAIETAASKHRYNLTQIRQIDAWAAKMEDWADYNIKAAYRHAWQARIYVTNADIRAIKHAARDVCDKAQNDAYQGENPGSAYNYYSDESKFGPIAAKNVARRYKKAAEGYKRLEQEYEAVGETFAKTRADLVRGNWRWFYQYEGDGREKDAASMKYQLLKRFGYANRNRPEFKRRSSRDSDLNWYISYPFSEDRFHHICGISVYGQSETYEFFHKLDRFVSEPVETFDPFAGTLPPVKKVKGTPMERMSQFLSARLLQLFKNDGEIERQNTFLKEETDVAAPHLRDYETLEALIKTLTAYQRRSRAGAEVADQISEVEVSIEDTQLQIKKVQDAITKKREDIEAQKALRSGVKVMPNGRGRYRSLRDGETGTDADAIVRQLESSIANFEKLIIQAKADEERALDVTDPDAYGRAQQDVKRYTRLLAKRRADLAQINELRKPLKPPDTGNLIDLIEEESVLKAKLVRLNRDLITLKARARTDAAQFLPADDAGWDQTQRDYTLALRTIEDLKVMNSGMPDQLSDADTAPETIKAELDAALNGLQNFRPTVRDRMVRSKNRIERRMATIRKLNDRHGLLVKDVALKRRQAAVILAPQLISAGARESDEVLTFMKDTEKALKQGDKILDVLTSPDNALDAALEAGGAAEIERKVVAEGNKVLSQLYKVPDIPGQKKLSALKSHLENAKSALGVIKKVNGHLQSAQQLQVDLNNPDQPTLKEAFSYFDNIKTAADLVKDGFPIGGQAAGYYLDYIGKSISIIGAKAQSIQDRVLNDSILYNLPIAPEKHLYTAGQLKAELGAMNTSDIQRAVQIAQARRLIALMSARNAAQACNRSLSGTARCLNQQ